METVRFEKCLDWVETSKLYTYDGSSNVSGDYVSKKDHDAEVARLKDELAEVREFWKSTANAFASEVADCTELREAVAWYFEALEFQRIHIDFLYRYFFFSVNGRGINEWHNWNANGKSSAEDILPAAEAELKRLAGVK